MDRSCNVYGVNVILPFLQTNPERSASSMGIYIHIMAIPKLYTMLLYTVLREIQFHVHHNHTLDVVTQFIFLLSASSVHSRDIPTSDILY